MMIKPYIHLKTNEIYYVTGVVTNATNNYDGEKMILYHNLKGESFVREFSEFNHKFKPHVY